MIGSASKSGLTPELGLRSLCPDARHSGAAGLPFRTRVWPPCSRKALRGEFLLPSGPCWVLSRAASLQWGPQHRDRISSPCPFAEEQRRGIWRLRSPWVFPAVSVSNCVGKGFKGCLGCAFGPGLGFILFPSSFPVTPPAPCHYF